MPLFNAAITIEVERVTVVLQNHWNLTLGDRIKASQNHTYLAANSIGERFAVRVTPDRLKYHFARIHDEQLFVNFLASSKCDVCQPVPSQGGSLVVHEDELTMTVLKWARGSAIDFMSLRWMLDKRMVNTWGRTFAQLHEASREFSLHHPDVAARIQKWNEIHEGVLATMEVHEADVLVQTDSKHFGIVHGDLNTSNFFFVEEESSLSIFDFDQTQQGWYLWDLAQAMIGVVMLHEGGSFAGGAVAEANPAQFQEWLVEGYESFPNAGKVDLARFERMVRMRKGFYERFCRQAQLEGNIPEDMKWFIDYVVRWFDKCPLSPLPVAQDLSTNPPTPPS